jgi:hypothetical protein
VISPTLPFSVSFDRPQRDILVPIAGKPGKLASSSSSSSGNELSGKLIIDKHDSELNGSASGAMPGVSSESVLGSSAWAPKAPNAQGKPPAAK